MRVDDEIRLNLIIYQSLEDIEKRLLSLNMHGLCMILALC